MRNQIRRIVCCAVSLLPAVSAMPQGAMVVTDPTNLANNIVQQTESMAEAVEQKFIMMEELNNFTSQLRMMEEKAETFKKIARIIETGIEILEAVEYATRAAQTIMSIRDNVGSFADLTFEEKYKLTATLVDCGYYITKCTKGLISYRDNLKDCAKNGVEVSQDRVQQVTKYYKDEIKSEVIRALNAVDTYLLGHSMRKANMELYCCAFMVRQTKKFTNYYNVGKPVNRKNCSVVAPNGKRFYYYRYCAY